MLNSAQQNSMCGEYGSDPTQRPLQPLQVARVLSPTCGTSPTRTLIDSAKPCCYSGMRTAALVETSLPAELKHDISSKRSFTLKGWHQLQDQAVMNHKDHQCSSGLLCHIAAPPVVYLS